MCSVRLILLQLKDRTPAAATCLEESLPVDTNANQFGKLVAATLQFLTYKQQKQILSFIIHSQERKKCPILIRWNPACISPSVQPHLFPQAHESMFRPDLLFSTKIKIWGSAKKIPDFPNTAVFHDCKSPREVFRVESHIFRKMVSILKGLAWRLSPSPQMGSFSFSAGKNILFQKPPYFCLKNKTKKKNKP